MRNNSISANRVLTETIKRGIYNTLGIKLIRIKEPPRPQGGTRSLNTGVSSLLRKNF